MNDKNTPPMRFVNLTPHTLTIFGDESPPEVTETDKTLQRHGFDFCRIIEGIWNRPDICAQLDVNVLMEHLDMDADELSMLVSKAIHVADDCCILTKQGE